MWLGTSVTYNLNNEVTGDTNYAFDANGNPTVYNGVGKTMAFDQENRMTAYNGVISNGYRSDGLRAWKQNSAGTRTYFLYDLGGRIVCELTSAGAVQAEDTFGPLGLVERSSSGNAIGTGFFGFDPSGNQCLKLTSGGSVTASTIFDSYGNNASSPGSNNPSPFGFGGEFGDYTDTETGFVLCQHRFYDPLKCRWVNRDPIGMEGGMNLYEYGGDDPVGMGDASGFEAAPVPTPTSAPTPLTIIETAPKPIAPWQVIVILAGIEAAGELVRYTPGHPTGPFTIIGEGIANSNTGKWIINEAVPDPAPEPPPAPAPAPAPEPQPSSPNQMQKECERGGAPSTVDRVDKGNPDHNEKDHVHFTDGSALNNDGSWKHGGKELTNNERKWLRKYNWPMPH